MPWFKCTKCSRVVDEVDHGCKPLKVATANPKRSRKPSAESVRKHREATGNAYGKAYAKARAAAVVLLIAEHPGEFAALLEKTRIDNGLGPTRG